MLSKEKPLSIITNIYHEKTKISAVVNKLVFSNHNTMIIKYHRQNQSSQHY